MCVQRRDRPEQTNDRTCEPYRLRVPGAIGAGDVGLGDALKHVPSAVGLNIRQPIGELAVAGSAALGSHPRRLSIYRT